MNGSLEWFAAISGAIAAAMIAGDFGRRVTGWGFVLFVGGSIAWIASGLLAGTMPLAIQNMVLLLINIYGVWQYLFSKKKQREIERAEQANDTG